MAEKFQIPVIILTEKILAETMYNIAALPTDEVSIDRHSVSDPETLAQLTSKSRYEFTESGISSRWLPGSDGPVFYCNGDEHREDGTLTENASEVQNMFDKRLRKIETLKKSLPKPRIFSSSKNSSYEESIALVGWGSTLLNMKDVISEAEKEGIAVHYLHYDYLFPLDRESFIEFAQQYPNIYAIEGNATGQLVQMLDPE